MDVWTKRDQGMFRAADGAGVQRKGRLNFLSFGIRHILEAHGPAPGEAARGQIAIEARHFARLPELLNAPDSVEAAGKSWRGGLPLLRYTRRFGDEEYVVVLEVRSGRKMLVPDSYFIRKRRPA